MNETETPIREAVISPWWLVLCLVGVDYFSSLAYLPSLAVRAAGVFAPLGALLVVAVTLGIALPVYLYVVGRSPHGRGGIGLIERHIPGWRGKLLVLGLLAFVTTDFVATQNLSTADAAEHLLGNRGFNGLVDWSVKAVVQPWLPQRDWCRRLALLCDRQLVVTIILTLTTFGLWVYSRKYSPRFFLRCALIVVPIYLLLNSVVIGSGLWYAIYKPTESGSTLFHNWLAEVKSAAGGGLIATPFSGYGSLLMLAIGTFPFMALGLSGFELSMAVAPIVKGDPSATDQLSSRIRNMRKLLITAAAVMAVFLPAAVLAATLLVPHGAYQAHGAAVHRALAYLAHGEILADGRAGQAVNPLFGPAFGAVYDCCTIVMLCLAGGSVAVALHDFIPEYLTRMGMEIGWVRKLGVKLRFFNIILLVVAILFRARIDALEWVYTTSVLMLLADASLAGFLETRQRFSESRWKRLIPYLFLLALAFFLAMLVSTLLISRSGIEIALAFALGILITSGISRWIRSTELRFKGFRFADDVTRRRWEELAGIEFEVLVPHRPGIHSRAEKQQVIRRNHRIDAETPMIFIEATLGDTSEFFQMPLMRIAREDGIEVIFVTGCVSTAHVIAAIGLELSRMGRPPEIHFGWSDERPLSANLNFLLFGEGNVPWMVRALIVRACPDREKQPLVIIG